MYRKTVVVPRITVDVVRELEKSLPGVSAVITLVGSQEKAEMIAEGIVMAQLSGEEILDSTTSTVTESGWEIAVTVLEEED